MRKWCRQSGFAKNGPIGPGFGLKENKCDMDKWTSNHGRNEDQSGNFEGRTDDSSLISVNVQENTDGQINDFCGPVETEALNSEIEDLLHNTDLSTDEWIDRVFDRKLRSKRKNSEKGKRKRKNYKGGGRSGHANSEDGNGKLKDLEDNSELSQEADRILNIVEDMGFQLLASKEEVKQRILETTHEDQGLQGVCRLNSRCHKERGRL